MTRNSPENCWHSRFRSTVLLGFVFLGADLSFAATTPPKDGEEKRPGPVVQPIPFSHKRHRGAGLDCLDCHADAKSQEIAGFASERKCMFCHVSIGTDSPAIRQLAAAQKSGETIHWLRVYRLPAFVFFSHASHAKAGVDCVTCHGLVAERDVLAPEVSTKMQRCVECHRERRASIDCALCHQLGQ
jgi:Cytochrome c7 and related cytochrome c/Class III cytochrome C family